LHSRREHAPGHHGWLLQAAAALRLAHSSSNRKRTLNFWSRLSNQLRQRIASSLTVLRHESTMHWLGLVTLCGRSQRIVGLVSIMTKRDQGCKSASQLPQIVRQAKSWHLYHGCTAQLPLILVQSFNDLVNLHATSEDATVPFPLPAVLAFSTLS
jgi:hypothetical protein